MITQVLSPIERYRKQFGYFHRSDKEELLKYKRWFSKNCNKIACKRCGQTNVSKRNKLGLCKDCSIIHKSKNYIDGEVVNFKRCSKCNELKPNHLYRKDSSKKDGMYPSCIDCYRKRTGCVEKNRKVKIDSSGYPAFNGKRIHRYKMEAFLGRKLRTDEHVHHKNGNKKDYRLCNLELLSSSEHHKLHYQSMEVKPHEIERPKLSLECVTCKSIFNSVMKRAKYCSPHCRYVSRIEYFNKWYAKNKPKSKE